jgi:hypothetical protein
MKVSKRFQCSQEQALNIIAQVKESKSETQVVAPETAMPTQALENQDEESDGKEESEGQEDGEGQDAEVFEAPSHEAMEAPVELHASAEISEPAVLELSAAAEPAKLSAATELSAEPAELSSAAEPAAETLVVDDEIVAAEPSFFEEEERSGRKCGVCKAIGSGHNSRTCPQLTCFSCGLNGHKKGSRRCMSEAKTEPKTDKRESPDLTEDEAEIGKIRKARPAKRTSLQLFEVSDTEAPPKRAKMSQIQAMSTCFSKCCALLDGLERDQIKIVMQDLKQCYC